MAKQNRVLKSFGERKYIDFTNNQWKEDPLIGLKIFKIPYTMIQKLGILLMIINVFIPGTFWPVTNPIIWKFMIK